MPEKFKEEIEEILRQAEEVARKKPQHHKLKRLSIRLKNPFSQQPLRIRLPSISPGKLMLGGVALFLIALILNATIPGGVGPFIWAGVALFVFAYALFFIRPGGVKYEKRWRGRPIEDDGSASLVEKLRQWWRKRQE